MAGRITSCEARKVTSCSRDTLNMYWELIVNWSRCHYYPLKSTSGAGPLENRLVIVSRNFAGQDDSAHENFQPHVQEPCM